jgi:hypothetical protein
VSTVVWPQVSIRPTPVEGAVQVNQMSLSTVNWPYCAAQSDSFWPWVPVLAIVLSKGNRPEPPSTVGVAQPSLGGGCSTLSENWPRPPVAPGNVPIWIV